VGGPLIVMVCEGAPSTTCEAGHILLEIVPKERCDHKALLSYNFEQIVCRLEPWHERRLKSAAFSMRQHRSLWTQPNPRHLGASGLVRTEREVISVVKKTVLPTVKGLNVGMCFAIATKCICSGSSLDMSELTAVIASLSVWIGVGLMYILDTD